MSRLRLLFGGIELFLVRATVRVCVFVRACCSDGAFVMACAETG